MQKVSSFGNKFLSLFRNYLIIMEEKGFQVVFLQEASDFLDGIAEQARKKYIITSSRLPVASRIVNYSRNLKARMIFGSFELSTMVSNTDC